MALPILLQPFVAFLGDQERGTFVLSSLFSPGGSQNLWVDKVGQIRPIDGYAKQTVSALTTNTGASAATIRSMFAYKKTGGGTVTRQVVGVLDDQTNEWELWYTTDSGVNWTFISDRGATPVGQYPDWVQFGDTLYITVPKTEVPRKWDGTTLSATGATQLGAPTPTDAAVVGELTGAFAWRVVPVIATTGVEKSGGSVVSAVLNLSASQADLAWTADADGAVGGYNVYRTTGVGKIFYLSSYIVGRTTVAYRDNVADITLIRRQYLDLHGDPPPSGCYFCEEHRGRVWWGRTDTDPRKWFWSDPGLAESVWQTRNFLDASNADSMGDVSTGATGNYFNTFIIWLERSVWSVSGDGQIVGAIINWNLRKTNARAGTVHHRSVARVAAGARYLQEDGDTATTDRVLLAYFTPLGDIRLFDGDNDTIISTPKRSTLARLTYAQRGKVHVVDDTKRGLLIWYLPVDGGTECSIAVAWDYQHGFWYEWPTAPFASVIETDTASAAQLLLASQAVVATGGYVYQLWSGNTFDGTAITANWMTKPLYLAEEPGTIDMVRDKRHRYLDLFFAKDASPTNLLVGVFPPDAADTDSPDFTVAIVGTSQDRASLQNSSGQYYQNRGLRLRLQSVASSGPWTLTGMTLGYQVLPGQRRSA